MAAIVVVSVNSGESTTYDAVQDRSTQCLSVVIVADRSTALGTSPLT